MLRGVCIAVSVHDRRHLRYLVEPPIVVGAVRVLADKMGLSAVPSRILVDQQPRVDHLGTPRVRDHAAPKEILHGAWAGVQVNRKVPPVIPPGRRAESRSRVGRPAPPDRLARSTKTVAGRTQVGPACGAVAPVGRSTCRAGRTCRASGPAGPSLPPGRLRRCRPSHPRLRRTCRAVRTRWPRQAVSPVSPFARRASVDPPDPPPPWPAARTRCRPSHRPRL